MSLGIDPIPPGPIRVGPSVVARLATWRGLLAATQQALNQGRAVQARLVALDRLAPPTDPPPGAEPRAKAEAELERIGRELQKHQDASAAVAAGRAIAVPAGLYDLDVQGSGSGGGVSGLGAVWIVLAAIVVGGLAIYEGTRAYVKTLEDHQIKRIADLIQQGKDVSPIVSAMNPPPTTTKGIASITTPIAIAGGVLGLALLARSWKRS